MQQFFGDLIYKTRFFSATKKNKPLNLDFSLSRVYLRSPPRQYLNSLVLYLNFMDLAEILFLFSIFFFCIFFYIGDNANTWYRFYQIRTEIISGKWVLKQARKEPYRFSLLQHVQWPGRGIKLNLINHDD